MNGTGRPAAAKATAPAFATAAAAAVAAVCENTPEPSGATREK